MAIKIADNLNYAGQKPDFVRQQYDTLEDMKNVKDITMPPLYLAYCLETEKVYLYRKSNEVSEDTGKFREFTTGGGDATDQVREMPAASSSEYDKVYQYIGPNTVSYTQGYFYHCAEEEGVYYWEHISTGEVRHITSAEIAEIFENL